MIVEKSKVGGTTLLSVEGVIKLGESVGFFGDALKRVLAQEDGDVMIDLSRINYIDSTGIGELVGFLGRFQEVRRKLILVHPSEHIVKLLKVAHLDTMFPTFETAEEAAEFAARESGSA